MTANDPAVSVLTPANELEVSGYLQEFNEANLKVNLRGAGTKLNLGGPLAAFDRTISSAALTQLVDYQPEDLTITVQAGMPFAQLQAALAGQGQMLPLDPPGLPGQTIGGILATNRSGPRRLLYGTARDLLIGCRFVLADGSIGHSGGRVVKNVAGYDLHKLFIGSFGTLGFLTEVTFKVVPQPQFVGVGRATFSSVEKACQAARLCVRSNLMPAALEVMAAGLGSDAGGGLLFAAEGMPVAVEGQLAGLSAICREAGAVSVELLEDGPGALQAAANLENNYAGPDLLQLRVATTLTGLPGAFSLLAEIGRELGGEGQVCLRGGNGLAYLYCRADSAKLAAALPLIKKARQTFQVDGGSLVIERAPLEVWGQLDAWGSFGDAGPSMLAVKEALDPKHLLNPGVIEFS
jgi:glycolate oxidase FAD binding subunit